MTETRRVRSNRLFVRPCDYDRTPRDLFGIDRVCSPVLKRVLYVTAEVENILELIYITRVFLFYHFFFFFFRDFLTVRISRSL